MDHLTALDEIRRDLCRERSTIRNELRNYPQGSLMLVSEHGKTQKYMVGGNVPAKKRVGIGRQADMVRRLARKAFIDAKSEILSRNIELLEGTIAEFQQYGTPEVLAALPEHFDELPVEFLLDPASKQRGSLQGPFPDESVPIRQASLWLDGISAEEWGAMHYRPNMKYAESRTILMPNGLKVRTKSEAGIIGLYRDLALAYHYDEVQNFEELLWKISGMFASELGTSPLKSPDFILARADGKLIYHEHIGLINDPDYLADLQTKLKLYYACGIVPWDNLILTFDKPGGGINLQLAEAQIRAKGLI